MKLSANGIAVLARRLTFSIPLLHLPVTVAQPGIFSGLAQDEAQIHAAIERHSTRIEAKAASPEIPGSVSYRIFVEELIEDSDPGFALADPDLEILHELAAVSTQQLAAKHRAALEDICLQAARAGTTRAEIIELAASFDESRRGTERDLDLRFAEAMDRLTPATAAAVESRWESFSADKTIVYTDFDMTAFANEMPEAAHRVLLAGCTRFERMTNR